MKRHFSLIVVLSGFIVMVRCGIPFLSREPLPMVEPEILMDEIETHASRLKTFEGRARLTVVTMEGAFRGSIKVSMKMPDSLWMKVEGPFGIDVLTSRFGGGHVLLYSPWENVAYCGSMQRMSELQVLPLDMGTSDMDLVLGALGLLVPKEMMLGYPDSVLSDPRRYILTFQNGEKVWVDPEGPVVTRWEKKDHNGDLFLLWEGRDFKKRSGIRVPFMIRMMNNQPKQRVTLFFQSVKTNRPLKNGWCEVKIPDGVETIDL